MKERKDEFLKSLFIYNNLVFIIEVMPTLLFIFLTTLFFMILAFYDYFMRAFIVSPFINFKPV